jgi:hypothetical protein
MAIGYLSVGQCWPTANQAIDAYFSSVPVSVVNFSSGSVGILRTYKFNGVWTHLVSIDSGASKTFSAFTGVYGTCELSNSYDYAAAAAMWTFAFSTVIGLWYLSKNLGMIINAVKRW